MAQDKYKHLINRDLSWLQFNVRVLEEAENKENPLFERLNFVSIYHSNLFEFLRVRVGSLYDRLLLKKDETDPRSGMGTQEQLRAINREIRIQAPRRNAAVKEILAQLAQRGVYYKTGQKLTKYEYRFLERYFERNVLPLLSPHIIDKHHPFPFLQNDLVYIAVLLKTKNGNTRLGVIPAGGYFERLLFLPSKYVKFTLIEDLICLFAHRVFPKYRVLESTVFSVTRNADIDADEAFFEYDMSYRDIMEIIVKKRTRLEPIRVDLVRNNSADIQKLLLKQLGLEADQCFFNEVPVMMNFVGDLRRELSAGQHADLFYPPLTPQPVEGIDHDKPLIAQFQKKDVLLSYPYHDIKTYIRLLEEAAVSPRVISIKITLYRVAHYSKIVDALIRAAENGKEVIAVVELRARFDEENNIDWSKRLQEAGVSVIYGIENYKVHSKLTLITLKSGSRVSFITQFGTGNYNEGTAKLYTDLSYFTPDRELALNAQNVFKNLGTGNLVETFKYLLVSPLTLKPEVLRLIRRERDIAKTGAPARLWFKLNSLSDVDIINALVEASDAGVEVKMVIRGICCLSVEQTGSTRNIEIISIVGRFLEHERIYAFGLGERRKIYISSADFMPRNTERRVEVGAPILDPAVQERALDILKLALGDNVKARRQTGGAYRISVPEDGTPRADSQMAQYRAAYEQAGCKFPVR